MKRASGYLCAFLALSLLARPARADDASDRKDLIEDIEDELEDAADELEDLYRESSASPVSTAIRHAEQVKSLVDKLDRVKGDDSTARQMVDRYRDYANRFIESARYLVMLKDKQRSLEELPKSCDNLDRDLASRIAAFIDKKDPLGLEELPKLGESLRRELDSRWRDAESIKRDMDQWRGYAKRFGDSDGKWSDVRSELHTSADEVYGEWEKSWKLAEQQCANLRRGKDHPKIDAAMRELAVFSKGRDEIIKEAESHLDAAAGLLNGADRDSDDRDVASALAKADDISSSLAKLGYAKGADQRASEIVEKWPRYVEAYKAGVRQLLELKRWQFTLDSAVGKCEARDRTLADEIAKYKDATGIPHIETAARASQQETTGALDKAREHHRKMEQWNGNAQRLSISEGKWSYVTGYVRSAATGSFDYWKNALEKAERACADLARGTDHPKVQQAIKMLQGRIPAAARHSTHHDSTCTGVTAGGFCMADNQCLDGRCSSNKCEQCPSRDDGRCHPPGTCSQSDYNSRRDDKTRACGKPFNSDAYRGNQRVDCNALGELCNNAQACVRAREVVQQCFRGGDTRHMEELNTVRGSAARCEALLKDKRDRNLCQ